MQWDRDKVLMELSGFSFSDTPHGKSAEAYCQFYGLNFSTPQIPIQHHMGWVEAGEFRVVLQLFHHPQPKGCVFVFHGYFDHAGIYHHLIDYLLQLGFSVVIYDMPGHGLSSGKPTAINSFEQYQAVMDAVLDLCKPELAGPFHAVGQSTGAAVLMDRLSQPESRETAFDRVVFLAPLVRPKGWGGISSLHTVISPFVSVWRRSFTINSNDHRFVSFLKELDPLQSKWLAVDWLSALKVWVKALEQRQSVTRDIAIVQGTADQTVDWQHNIEVITSLFQSVKTVYVEGGHHHLVNEEESIRQAVFQAIKAELCG